ncbi:hypothetical protein [Methanosarcina siciliae]|uniref:hypothetical protein n=1 Tax=Methanosarcina siciliae TaxID=38027 RepID=UPI000AD7A09F|nr:hypothetical protein [Methanosarcina siciliae]
MVKTITFCLNVKPVNVVLVKPEEQYFSNSMMHTKAFDLFRAWYNFIKPHKPLRLGINSGNRKWFQRTPAMEEGITDHIWSLKELLTFRVPVQ